MKWTLSDGTVVHLGGLIEGDSSVAERFRNAVTLIALGLEPFDLDDSARMHAWVYACADLAGIEVVDSPYHCELLVSRRGERKFIRSRDPKAKMLPSEERFIRYRIDAALEQWERERRSKSTPSE